MAKISSLRLNQDCTFISICSNHGYAIYNASNYIKIFSQKTSVLDLLLLGKTSLIGLIGSGDDPSFSPRRVRLYNIKNDCSIVDMNFSYSVRRLFFGINRLIAILDRSMFIFELKTLTLLQSHDTALNSNGVASISLEPHHFVAIPSNSGPGVVTIFDLNALQKVNIISAHHSSIRQIQLSFCGSYLATASVIGTVIRVFDTISGSVLFEFRRGAVPAIISTLSFNQDASLLAVASHSDTIHIFKCQSEEKKAGIAQIAHSLMPKAINRITDPCRAFITILKNKPQESPVCLGWSELGEFLVVFVDKTLIHINRYALTSEGDNRLIENRTIEYSFI